MTTEDQYWHYRYWDPSEWEKLYRRRYDKLYQDDLLFDQNLPKEKERLKQFLSSSLLKDNFYSTRICLIPKNKPDEYQTPSGEQGSTALTGRDSIPEIKAYRACNEG